jgi:hypothetical protein
MTPITSAAPRLAGRIVERTSLDAGDRDVMFQLLSTSFTGVDRETFHRDLSGKSHVILLEDDRGSVHGFSTLQVYRSRVPGVDATIVYSGDTIVDPRWWGSSALPLTWLRAVRQLAGTNGGDLYWLLLTSGFRTYRFLPVFFREFDPRYDSDGDAGALLDTLARERFGDLYDEQRGIVRFDRPQVLVPELLDVPVGRTHDAHVTFFLERNPGYVRGDELVCLTRVHEDNLTPAGRRIARSLKG